MTIDQLIYDTLRNDAGVSAIAGTRVFSDFDESPEDPSGDLSPFVVFALESQTELVSMSPPASSHGWYKSTYSVQCVTRTAETKVALADAVKAALRPLRGTYTDLHLHDVVLQNVEDARAEELSIARIRIRNVVYEFTHSAI